MKNSAKRNHKQRDPSDGKILIAYIFLRLFVLAVMLDQFILGNYTNVFLCVLTLILFMIPIFTEEQLQINLPNVLEFIILLFIFAAEILGEIKSYYISVPYWDSMLHTVNGFLMAAIGFAMIDILNTNDKFRMKLSPIFVALFAICFSMAIGVAWEFFEFGMDMFFKTDMQKDVVIHTMSSVALNPNGGNIPIIIDVDNTSINQAYLISDGYLDIGLYDTMTDLAVNAVGAIVFSILGWIYIKNRDGAKFVENFLPTKMSDIPRRDSH